MWLVQVQFERISREDYVRCPRLDTVEDVVTILREHRSFQLFSEANSESSSRAPTILV